MSTRYAQASAFIAAATVMMVGVSGCGSSGTSPSLDHSDTHVKVAAADNVVVVAGPHANSPRPVLAAAPRAVVANTLDAGGTVSVIRVSARPVIDDDLQLRPVEGTPEGRAAIVRKNLHRIDTAITEPATSNGSDVLEAITLATGQLRATSATHPAIVITDSGLSDSGRLQFTTPGMLGADPTEVATFLSSAHALPDLTNITIYLSGLGYTAPPQQPLDGPQRTKVVDIWTQILRTAGASVIIDAAPNTAAPIDTDHTVATIDVPAPPAQPPTCTAHEIIFDAQSAVSFIPETNTFIDPDAAAQALTPIAQWLAAKPARTATIRGTTANDRSPAQRLHALGQTRADAVHAFFIDHGARASQLTATGVGADFPEYLEPDLDPTTGDLLPGPAAINRSVRIALNDPCT